MDERRAPDPRDDVERQGTGALCPEAQADGVPCSEAGRDCEVCDRAKQDPNDHHSH